MKDTLEASQLKKVIANLKDAKFTPVFVGGLALILLGSDRTTFDTDLILRKPQNLKESQCLTKAMSKAKCYYVSKLDSIGNPISYIDNANVAASRIMIDKPDSIFFWNPDIEMRIDILLDFPLKADELLLRAENKKLDKSTVIKIASLLDLKKMKEIAIKARKNSKDLQDLEFIKNKIMQKI
ncbi:MAG: hypothetical protein KAV18_05215 [Candidatus Omnitrophica bacterium]|nr:hypothetical protein [Candidatus Omnitrophota bacterium]